VTGEVGVQVGLPRQGGQPEQDRVVRAAAEAGLGVPGQLVGQAVDRFAALVVLDEEDHLPDATARVSVGPGAEAVGVGQAPARGGGPPLVPPPPQRAPGMVAGVVGQGDEELVHTEQVGKAG
jgi:hypothetical protein